MHNANSGQAVAAGGSLAGWRWSDRGERTIFSPKRQEADGDFIQATDPGGPECSTDTPTFRPRLLTIGCEVVYSKRHRRWLVGWLGKIGASPNMRHGLRVGLEFDSREKFPRR